MAQFILLMVELASRGWDRLRARGAPFHKEEFVALVSQAYKDCIDVAHKIDRYTPSELQEAATKLLAILALIVEGYSRRDARVTANYLVPMDSTPALVSRAMFTNRARRDDTYECFLVLQQWHKQVEDLPLDIVVPVDKPGQPTLFGAATAFMEGTHQLTGDSRKISSLLTEQTDDVREEVAAYFKSYENRLRSFVSFPLNVPAGIERHRNCSRSVVCVVNINSSRTHLLGIFAGNQKKLRLVLAPLLHALTQVVVRLHCPLIDEQKSTEDV